MRLAIVPMRLIRALVYQRKVGPLLPSASRNRRLQTGAMKRPRQPAERATAFVMLADPLSSYVSGATIAVTGGKPIL